MIVMMCYVRILMKAHYLVFTPQNGCIFQNVRFIPTYMWSLVLPISTKTCRTFSQKRQTAPMSCWKRGCSPAKTTWAQWYNQSVLGTRHTSTKRTGAWCADVERWHGMACASIAPSTDPSQKVLVQSSVKRFPWSLDRNLPVLRER